MMLSLGMTYMYMYVVYVNVMISNNPLIYLKTLTVHRLCAVRVASFCLFSNSNRLRHLTLPSIAFGLGEFIVSLIRPASSCSIDLHFQHFPEILLLPTYIANRSSLALSLFSSDL